MAQNQTSPVADFYDLHFQFNISSYLLNQPANLVTERKVNSMQEQSVVECRAELGSCYSVFNQQLLHAIDSKRQQPVNTDTYTPAVLELLKTKQDLLRMRVKNVLANNFVRHYAVATSGGTSRSEAAAVLPPAPILPLQAGVFQIMNSYKDFLHHEQCEEDGTADRMRQVYCLHVLNHTLKTRARIMHHSSRLREQEQSNKLKKQESVDSGGIKLSEIKDLNAGDDDKNVYRDQGFARSKVLLLLPFRETAHRVVKILSTLLKPSAADGIGVNEELTREADTEAETLEAITNKAQLSVMHQKRFDSEYGLRSAEDPIGKLTDRPADFRATFAGNTDDKFCLGITVTKRALKLYTKFEDADLIIASPLGLRIAMTTPPTPSTADASSITSAATAHTRRDPATVYADFLSSIEVLVIDRADVLYMQNWSHILFILEHINRLPRSLSNVVVDVRRIRAWALNDYARYYRQTIVLSAVPHVAFDSLARSALNYEGCMQQWRPPTPPMPIDRLAVSCELTFHNVESRAADEDAEKRFASFCSLVLPQLSRLDGALLFVPSYFDFVRLRNYFTSEDVSFTFLNEYQKAGQSDRARTLFLRREKRVLIMTGRFHFYHRYRIRGIRHVVFYALPEHPQLFAELINMILLGGDEADEADMKDGKGKRRGNNSNDDSSKKKFNKRDDGKKSSQDEEVAAISASLSSPSTVIVLFSKLDYRTMLATMGAVRTTSLTATSAGARTTKFLTQV